MAGMATTVPDRRERLVTLLEQRGEVELTALVRELAVSEATLRRDLAVLQREGRLARTFGGARSVPPPSLVARTFGEKRAHMQAAKEAIAREAAKLVEPGMVVALDSGTTAWRIAAALKDKAPLTILTSALAPLEELGAVPGISIHLVGGRFHLDNLDFTGTMTVEGYRQLHADFAFVGADSFLPGKGAFSLDENGAAVASAIARSADRRVVVMDHSKFNAKCCCLVLAAADINCLITDDGVSEQVRSGLQAEPFKLILARNSGLADQP
jgi:DeoR/GlpR family transcriptional regulator of sugar metabolism